MTYEQSEDMRRYVVLRISGHVFAVHCPASLATGLATALGAGMLEDAPQTSEIIDIVESGTGVLGLSYQGLPLWDNLDWPSLLQQLRQTVAELVARRCADTVVECGVARLHGKAVMVLTPDERLRPAMTAWLCANGFEHCSDLLASLANAEVARTRAHNAVSPVRYPALIQPDTFGRSAPQDAAQEPPAAATLAALEHCSLVIAPRFREGAELRIDALPPAQLGFHLAQAIHPLQGDTASAGRIGAFCNVVPGIQVQFGDFQQLDDGFDALVRAILASGVRPNGIGSFIQSKLGEARQTREEAETTIAATTPVAIAAPRAFARKRLTIGMATYDDFDGVYFTVQSLRMHHAEALDDVEFVVLDNNPAGVCGEALRYWAPQVPNLRYISLESRTGTAVRDYIMAEASGDHVLSLDCHVLLERGAVAKLMAYFDAHPHCNDLLQGPLLQEDLRTVSTHMTPTWRDGFFGSWATDERGVQADAEPFEIPMQGLGVYACRRAAWPGFNRAFRGFGGEEGYIHEKFRQRGGRVICLPFLRWLHRFQRPFGVPYPMSWADRVHNYLVGAAELGVDQSEIREHFSRLLGDAFMERLEPIPENMATVEVALQELS